MKTHIKKAEFANKVLRLLHSKTEGEVYIWRDEKPIKVTQGLTKKGFEKLDNQDKLKLLESIFIELQDMHNSIISARHNRRRIRKRDELRAAAGKKIKRRTTKEEYENMKKNLGGTVHHSLTA